jgi:YD repeat-containing protein
VKNGPGHSTDRIGDPLTETRGALTDTYAYYQHSPEGQLVDIATVGARSTLTYDGRGFLRRAEKPAFSIFEDSFETVDTSCWSDAVPGAAESSSTTGGPGCFTPGSAITTTATYGSEGLLYALQRHTGERHHVLHFAGRPVAQLRVPTAGAATFTYLTTDHLGTPVLAMNQAGATLWRGGFDPFGNDWNGTAGAAGVFLRFPGQWEDLTWAGVGTAGLSYNLHRWYERGTGRYERADPLNLGRLLNSAQPNGMIRPESVLRATLRLGNPKFEASFDYSARNPVTFVDPDGQYAFPVCAPALAALGEALAVGTGIVLGAVAGDWLYDKLKCDGCTEDNDKPHCERLLATDGVTCSVWISLKNWRNYHACMSSAMFRYADCRRGIFPPRYPLSPTPFGRD